MTNSPIQRQESVNAIVENMRKQVEEIATHMGGTVDHFRDDTFSDWLRSSIHLPNGMAIFFRNDTRSHSKPIFEISFDWNISAKNGSIWDRMSHLTKDRSVNIYQNYHDYPGIGSINVSALKSSDRVAKEIKSRMLTEAAEEAFDKHLETWIGYHTREYNQRNTLRRIAPLCKAMYPIDIDRIGSDTLYFSSETYKNTKIKTSCEGKFNLELGDLTEEQLMTILKIADRLK